MFSGGLNVRWLAAALLTTGVVAAGAAPAPTPSRSRPAPVASSTWTPEAEATASSSPRRSRPDTHTAPSATSTPTTATAATAPTIDVDRLQAALDGWVASNPKAGSVAVAMAVGDATWTGVAAPPGRALLDPDERHGVLSVTKTFTEALVLRQVAAGRIDLDAPMPVLPGVVAPPAGVAITPRMLLEHSSGLVNYPDAVGYDRTAPITPQQIVSSALRTPLRTPPGTTAYYSNTNFHWLGLLLEHVTGSTFGALVAGLAAEVGLPDTALDPTGRPGWIGYASGGIRSTVGDMARWGAALFTPGRVLPAAQLRALTTVGPLGVSLGLWPTADGGLSQFVAHGGLVHYPAHDLVVVARIVGGTSPIDQAKSLAAVLKDAVGSAAVA